MTELFITTAVRTTNSLNSPNYLPHLHLWLLLSQLWCKQHTPMIPWFGLIQFRLLYQIWMIQRKVLFSPYLNFSQCMDSLTQMLCLGNIKLSIHGIKYVTDFEVGRGFQLPCALCDTVSKVYNLCYKLQSPQGHCLSKYWYFKNTSLKKYHSYAGFWTIPNSMSHIFPPNLQGFCSYLQNYVSK
jgi:hypothetical protein